MKKVINQKHLYKRLTMTLLAIYCKASLYVLALPALLVMGAKACFEWDLTTPFYILLGIWTVYFITVAYRSYNTLNKWIKKGVYENVKNDDGVNGIREI